MILTDVSVYNYINHDTPSEAGTAPRELGLVVFLGQSYWGISGFTSYLCHISAI